MHVDQVIQGLVHLYASYCLSLQLAPLKQLWINLFIVTLETVIHFCLVCTLASIDLATRLDLRFRRDDPFRAASRGSVKSIYVVRSHTHLRNESMGEEVQSICLNHL
jgi:hypothetical protein